MCSFHLISDAQTFTVQVVDAMAFARRNPDVDFDVNNLKINQSHGIQIKQVQGQAKEATNLQQIMANVQAKQLFVLKPVGSVNGRIEKMKLRGWKIMFPQ